MRMLPPIILLLIIINFAVTSVAQGITSASECEELQSYLECLSSKRTDIIFVFDTTMSMGEEIAEVKAISKKFADNLTSSDIDYRLGLTEFRDFYFKCGDGNTCGGDGSFPYKVYNGGILTDNSSKFKDWIDGLETGGSGGDIPESTLAAIAHTVTDQKWSGGNTSKIAILITDAPPHPDGHCCNRENNTLASVISSLAEQGIKVYVIGPDDKSLKRIAADTGGKFYQIRSGLSLEPILADIAGGITCSFNIDGEATCRGTSLSVCAKLTGKGSEAIPYSPGNTGAWVLISCPNASAQRYDLQYQADRDMYCATIDPICIGENGTAKITVYGKVCNWSSVEVWDVNCRVARPTAADLTVATTLADSTAFLYSGPGAIQTNVTEEDLVPGRLAVVRGKVLTPDGTPLQDVKITVLGHPEFGETQTRDDGIFDMAVNGGGQLTIRYEKDGYLTVQRKINVPWQDYVWAPDVVMVTVDEKVTAVNLKDNVEMQVAKGSEVTDQDGSRQATLLILGNTTAEITLPDGSKQQVEGLHVRATEFTVGPNGTEAMPDVLPPTTGYTYAMEYTADEALEAGAKDVNFSKPLVHYVENFLNFSVGGIVPVGYYDREKATWIPSDNGRVVAVLAVNNGLAELDVDGSGKPANETALNYLNITDEELKELAKLYKPGQSLWRAPIPHFTPWDLNWPWGASNDTEVPNGTKPESGSDQKQNPCYNTPGSSIDIQNQILGEDINIVGVPFDLHYSSNKVPGRYYVLSIPLSDDNIPASLKGIKLEIYIAGKRYLKEFPADPRLSYNFVWDGKDAYSRTVQGSQSVKVRVGYVYNAVYMKPYSAEIARSFARFSEVPIEGTRGRTDFTLWQEWDDFLGSWNVSAQKLGGWSLSIYHAYDPATKTLYLGNGRRQSGESINQIINTAAGTGRSGYSGDGGPAVKALFNRPDEVTVGPDGSLYVVDIGNNVIRRVDYNGTITTIAGTGQRGYSGDGGPAIEAQLNDPEEVAFGLDGSLYIADKGNNRIRKVSPDGNITTVAGNGTRGYSGDGGPATRAQLNKPTGVSIAPDGGLYITDSGNNRIRRVDPDGVIITVVGTGQRGYSGDGVPAIESKLSNPSETTVGSDGSLYITDPDNNRIRKVDSNGIITTIAGNGTKGYSGDGGPATEAQLSYPNDIALDADGSLYITDSGNSRIRMVGPDGIIITVVGNGVQGYGGDKGQATKAQLSSPNGIDLAPDGSLYIADEYNHRVRRVGPPISGTTAAAPAIPSEDGNEVYLFDANGRHLHTLDALTGAILYRFNYDDKGRLMSVEDVDGDNTTIERDPSGNATSIVSPYGQRTNLSIGSDGYLASIANTAGETNRFNYSKGGLLTALTGPNGNTYRFTYDDVGRLIKDQDPIGGFKSLNRIPIKDGYKITLTTALGRESNYLVKNLPTGDEYRSNACCGENGTEVYESTNGTSRIAYPDGTVITTEEGPDPRFGMQSPLTKKMIIRTPGGLEATTTSTRSVELMDPGNPISLKSLIDVMNINGRVYKNSFDATTGERTYTTPEGRQSVVRLDNKSHVIEARVGDLEPIIFTYSSRGSLIGASQAGSAINLTYDEQNRPIASRDSSGNKTQYSYDESNRLIQTVLPSGRTYRFAYDPAGDLTVITMPNGALHRMTYNEVNLLSNYSPPQSNSYNITYDKDRNIANFTLPSGRSIDYEYDRYGQLIGNSYPEARGSFAYDDSQRLTNISRTSSGDEMTQEISFGYDGKLLIEMIWSGVVNSTYRYSYDDNLSLVKIASDAEPEVNLTNDKDGLLTSIGPFKITRNEPAGAATQISDGRMTIDITYDKLGRTAIRTHSINGQQVYRLALSYDNSSQIVSKQETANNETHTYNYSYDADGQLVQVRKDNVIVERYAYDDNGNRILRQVGESIPEAATYDIQDRLLQRAGMRYNFNDDGFLIQRDNETFKYSAIGELLQANLSDGKIISFAYDGLGRRVARTDVVGTYQYMYGDPERPVRITATKDQAGVISMYYYDDGDRLFAVKINSSWCYVAADQVGTPKSVYYANGQIVDTTNYDSFGGKISDSNLSFNLPIGFAGGIIDDNTELIRFGWRDYEPASGRWAAKDPIGFMGGLANLYIYVFNDPINFRDLYGTKEYTDNPRIQHLQNVWDVAAPAALGAAFGPAFAGGYAFGYGVREFAYFMGWDPDFLGDWAADWWYGTPLPDEPQQPYDPMNPRPLTCPFNPDVRSGYPYIPE